MTNDLILAVIPARAGSKGLRDKNLRMIRGKTLTQLAIEVAKSSVYIDQVLVSSDSYEILSGAKVSGVDIVLERADELSGDYVSALSVWQDALGYAERILGRKIPYSVYLEPTCPLRTVDHVNRCIEKLIHENRDSVWTISKVDKKLHPKKQLSLSDEGNLNYITADGEGFVARQLLEFSYIRNGACYAATRDLIINQNRLIGNFSSAVVLDEFILSVDTAQDLLDIENYIINRVQNVD